MPVPGKPTPKGNTSVSYPISVAIIGTQVGCITLAIVLASVFGGMWIDKQLGTKLVFTFVLVLVSAPVSLFLSFRIAMRSMKNITKNTKFPSHTDRETIAEKENEE